MLLVKPRGWKKYDRRPAVVWIHGGGWNSGKPEWFLPHCRYFSFFGAVSLTIQYRLMGESGVSVTLKDCIDDCRSAIKFIRENAEELGVDPKKIVACGDSAGGYLALCLATSMVFEKNETDPSAVPDAVIDCNGITDMTRIWKKDVPNLPSEIGDGRSESEYWLNQYNEEKYYSPVYHVATEQPPVLILHGLSDSVVDPEDAVRFYEEYLSAGNDAQLILYPYYRHAFILFNYTTPMDDIMQALSDIKKFLSARGFMDGESMSSS